MHFAEIIGWLANNADDDQYMIAGRGGAMLIQFADEQLATQCKLVWSEFMELV
jgi:hypothetical protein